MTGERLKVTILKLEKSLANVARRLDMTPQALNQTLTAADIKTGFVENLAVAYNLPISFFYEESNTSIEDHSSKVYGYGNAKTTDNRTYGNSEKVKELEEKILLLESQLRDKERLIRLYESLNK